MAWNVVNIIDGDTIRISPNWILGEFSGDIVKVRGYKTPPESVQPFAIKKLKTLLLNKSIELKNAQKYNADSEALLSGVFLNGVDISTYFPEYKV